MKKSIITALLVVATMCAIAQTKTESVKPVTAPAAAKQYPGIPNNTRVTLTVSVPAAIWSDYLIVAQVGPDAIDNSNEISAQRAKQFKLNYKVALDSLNANWNAYVQADTKRWAADTLKEYNKLHPVKK